MMGFKKGLYLILVIITSLCQNVAFCLPLESPTLRVPVNGSPRIKKAIELQKNLLTLNEDVEGFLRHGASFNNYSKLTLSQKEQLRKEFDETFAPLLDYDWPNNIYPLTIDSMITELVKTSEELSRIYPNANIISVGRSPLWFIEVAKLLDGSPERFGYAAFTGSWYAEGGGGNLKPDLSQPDKRQRLAYRSYLEALKLDPKTIITLPRKTVFVDYTRTGATLRSFISILEEWADELGMLKELQGKIIMHRLVVRIVQSDSQIRPYKNTYQIVSYELLEGLSKSDPFKDSLGFVYPWSRWGEVIPLPLTVQVSRRAALVRFRLMDWLVEHDYLREKVDKKSFTLNFSVDLQAIKVNRENIDSGL